MTDTTDFPELPAPAVARVVHDGQQTSVGLGRVYTAEQMRDYVLADRASRAPAQEEAIATAAPTPFGWWLETGSTKTNRMYFYWAEAHQAWEREGGAASEAYIVTLYDGSEKKPLTKAEAKRLWLACKSIDNEAFCVEFTQAIESAHGIGAQRRNSAFDGVIPPPHRKTPQAAAPVVPTDGETICAMPIAAAPSAEAPVSDAEMAAAIATIEGLGYGAEGAQAPTGEGAKWHPVSDTFAANWLTNGAALYQLTVNLVVRFARALAAKLAAAEGKYGYSDGGVCPDWRMDERRAKLLEHTAKGDPRDVAAYCAFLWHHGESTSPTPQAATGTPDANRCVRCRKYVRYCQCSAAQPLVDQNDIAVRDCIERWLLLDNVALVPGECVPLQTSAPVTYPILAAIFEAGYKSGRAS